jgi:hypothetical protein
VLLGTHDGIVTNAVHGHLLAFTGAGSQWLPAASLTT